MTCLSMGYLLYRKVLGVDVVPTTPKGKIDLWLMTQWLTNNCAVWCQRACHVVVVVCNRYFVYAGGTRLLFRPVRQTMEHILCMYHGKTMLEERDCYFDQFDRLWNTYYVCTTEDFAVREFSNASVSIPKISNKHRLSLLTLQNPRLLHARKCFALCV